MGAGATAWGARARGRWTRTGQPALPCVCGSWYSWLGGSFLGCTGWAGWGWKQTCNRAWNPGYHVHVLTERLRRKQVGLSRPRVCVPAVRLEAPKRSSNIRHAICIHFCMEGTCLATQSSYCRYHARSIYSQPRCGVTCRTLFCMSTLWPKSCSISRKRGPLVALSRHARLLASLTREEGGQSPVQCA